MLIISIWGFIRLLLTVGAIWFCSEKLGAFRYNKVGGQVTLHSDSTVGTVLQALLVGTLAIQLTGLFGMLWGLIWLAVIIAVLLTLVRVFAPDFANRATQTAVRASDVLRQQARQLQDKNMGLPTNSAGERTQRINIVVPGQQPSTRRQRFDPMTGEPLE